MRQDFWKSTGLAGAGLLLWCAWLAIFLRYLPNAGGGIGQDYALHFPNLLAGYFWLAGDGGWTAPWFNPAQCGGMAFFADPNVGFYSLPQLLTLWVSPLRAVQITFAAFGLFGLCGAYGLMRGAFAASRPAAALASGLFLFNGFYAYRMLAGHLTFHAFALLPALAWALLPAPDSALSKAQAAARIGMAGAMFAYMFQTGMVHGIPPALLSLAVLFLIHGLAFGWRPAPWLLTLGAGGLALALCASKLAAELALLSNFPRNAYPLPGIDGLGSLAFLLSQSLFGFAPEGAKFLVNTPWLMLRHEWEYGLSITPLVALIVLARNFLKQAPAARLRALSMDRKLGVAAVVLLLAAPAALNFYEPAWNALLKSLPYFRNSSSLLRFFSAYILVVAVAAGMALDRLTPSDAKRWQSRAALAAFGLGAMLAQNLATPRGFYAAQDYFPAAIEAAYAKARMSGEVPPISSLGDDAGIGQGQSRLNCYQPLFGYRLEAYPKGALHAGPVMETAGGRLNLKDPACYVFPAQNACKPGDHFAADRLDDATAFTHYRPYDFAKSNWQQAADALNAAALVFAVVGVLALAVAAAIRALRRSRRASVAQ